MSEIALDLNLFCLGDFDKLPETVNSLISYYSSAFYLFIVILIYGATNYMSGHFLNAFCVYCPLIYSHQEPAAIYISDRLMVLAKSNKIKNPSLGLIPKTCLDLCCRATNIGWILTNPLKWPYH